jgi:hypothetical protein
MSSGLYVETLIDVLDTTQLALDLDLETHKAALYTSSRAPDYGVDTAYTSTNEIVGTGYTAGGQALTTTAVSESPTGSLKFDADDPSWTSSTITNARYLDLYADALAGNNLIAGVDFGANYSTSSGTFTVQWASGGIFAIDLTP